MSYKIGMFRRLKSCYYILVSKKGNGADKVNIHSNVPILSCAVCGSLNVIKIKSDIIDTSTKHNCSKETSTRYLCLNCLALCDSVQKWSKNKYTKEDFDMLRTAIIKGAEHDREIRKVESSDEL